MISVVGATLLLNLYACALVTLRAGCYRTQIYRPMLWNIFLSVLPVFVLSIGGILGVTLLLFSRPLGITILVVIFCVWLLLLPNSSYLITELNLSHRNSEESVPEWYDIILVITLAMSGVANAVVNVFIAHAVFATTLFSDQAGAFLMPPSVVFVVIIMVLQSFGIYLGRFPRFNSWDLTHPTHFARKIFGHFSSRNNRIQCVGFTLTYSIFLIVIYALVAGPVISGLIDLENLRVVLQ